MPPRQPGLLAAHLKRSKVPEQSSPGKTTKECALVIGVISDLQEMTSAPCLLPAFWNISKALLESELPEAAERERKRDKQTERDTKRKTASEREKGGERERDLFLGDQRGSVNFRLRINVFSGPGSIWLT